MECRDVLLAVRDLKVQFRVYGGIARVLDSVSLDVSRGERLGLVGETGCGKSVAGKAVMRMITGRGATVTGRVLFRDVDLLALGRRELRGIQGLQIAMIPQDPMTSINPMFTVGRQMRDVVRRRKKDGRRLSANEADRFAQGVLEEVLLPDPALMMRRYPHQLSGGMRQRVLISLAVVNEPQLVVEDEPGTALDVTVQREVLELFDNMVARRRMSTILITHNLGVIREFTDRSCIMYGGCIVETARSRDLFEAPAHPYTRALLRCVPRLTRDGIPTGIPGMIPDYTSPPDGCRYHPRCEAAGGMCQTAKPCTQELGMEHSVACHLRSDGGSLC